jgi:histidinol-phosphatase (PHP family)
MDEYLAEIKRLRGIYQDQIELYAGIELGLLPYLGPRLSQLLAPYKEELDFVIASSHLVKMLDPYEPKFFDTYSEKEGIELYLQTILDNIEGFSDFDVYGHLDYVVRYAPHKEKYYNPADFSDYFDAILKKLIARGKGIELNTAGLKAGLSFAHPHPDVLKRYRELGGEIITIGSDGHCPNHLAYAFEQVPDLLKAAGFSYYTVFQKRKPHWIKL